MHLQLVTEYKLDELAEASGVAARTVRYYVQRGLLPAPDFRGSQTTYDDDHLVRLRAIKRLQDERLSLDEIEARLAHASRGEIAAIADGTKKSHGASKARAPSSPYREAPPVAPSKAPPRVEAWERIVLFPGVELHVKSDASVEARRAALEVEAIFAKR